MRDRRYRALVPLSWLPAVSPRAVWLVRVWAAETLMGNRFHAPYAVRSLRSLVPIPKSAPAPVCSLTVQ
jgi:hypothetical protein